MRLKKYFAIATIAALSASCAEDLVGVEKPNDPVNNFEYFWKAFDTKYGLFEVKQIDWQKVHDDFRPLVNVSTTDGQLYKIFTDMINLLNDNHVNLYPTNGTLPVYPGGLLRVVNRKVIITKAQEDYDFDVVKKYITDIKQHTSNLTSAKLPESIGYLNIKGTDSMKDAEKAMNEVIGLLNSRKGLVIDIRGFNGGSDFVTQVIAGHFATEKKLYMTTRKRNGPQHNNFTEALEWFVEPHGAAQYTKPIILLTSRFSQSTAETFALAMNELAHVKLLGDTTAGSYSDNPTTEMYNGWMFSISVGDFRAADGKSYEGIGTAPDIWMVNTKEDLLAGKDRVLEQAIDLLK